MFPEFSARTEFPRSAHPGTVTFVGTDGVERVELAEYLPDWLKFAPTPDGRVVPVVRVVRLATDRGYSLRSYDPAGRLVWVGLTVPPAPVPNGSVTPSGRWAWQERPAPSPAPATEPTGWF